MAAGGAQCFGAVIDPTLNRSHKEIREQLLSRKLDVILDPRTQAAATPGGFTESLSELPWGGNAMHTLESFQGQEAHRRVSAIADFAVDNGYTQVIAPTHLLANATDPWLSTDVSNLRLLRQELDRRSKGADIPIIYSLALPYASFRSIEARSRIIHALSGEPIDALWLKVDGIGASCTSTALLNYLEATQDFQEIGAPVIADHIGGLVGLSLLALGACGGLAQGIGVAERFDASSWRRVRSGEVWSTTRVYVPMLDTHLTVAQADQLLNRSNQTKGWFGCRDTRCCPKGVGDTLANPHRHLMHHRTQQVAGLAGIPGTLRPQHFYDNHVRPASDAAFRATSIDWPDEALSKKLGKERKRIDQLRRMLEDQIQQNKRILAKIQLPKTRAAREARP